MTFTFKFNENVTMTALKYIQSGPDPLPSSSCCCLWNCGKNAVVQPTIDPIPRDSLGAMEHLYARLYEINKRSCENYKKIIPTYSLLTDALSAENICRKELIRLIMKGIDNMVAKAATVASTKSQAIDVLAGLDEIRTPQPIISYQRSC